MGHRRLNASSEADGELEVDAPGGEVVRDGVAPARDVLNPRVVDGVADAEEVEDLERYEAFEGLGAVGTVLLDAASLTEEEVARKANVHASVGR